MNTNQLDTVVANMVIEFRIKQVYGKDTLYIASEHAKAIAALTGKKTIDWTDVHSLELLGFKFTQVF